MTKSIYDLIFFEEKSIFDLKKCLENQCIRLYTEFIFLVFDILNLEIWEYINYINVWKPNKPTYGNTPSGHYYKQKSTFWIHSFNDACGL
jgi:hypothetical protein